MKALTFSKREEVKAWEQEFVPCEHTLCLVQDSPRQIESQGKSQILSTIGLYSHHKTCRSRPVLNV